jgi:hypothetical protein
MRVRSIGHACLDIQTRGPRVLTDPWWTGPAYTRQWYPWPRPAHAGVADTAYDYVYLSHGHEDHLHLDTLRTLRPGATAIVPRFAGTGGLGWLRGEGLFADVRELAHGESLDLGGGVTATMYINVTDSMLVLDDGRHVLVDANDALHAAPRATRDDFTALLRARHGRVDSLYLGFGGASWFPNCIHWPGKDDRAEAMRREGALIDNFVSIVEALEPSLACAFAASFVLLEPHLRWVVDARYAVEGPDERLRRVGRAGRTRGHLLLPGDVIDGVHVTPSGDAAPTVISRATPRATPRRRRWTPRACRRWWPTSTRAPAPRAGPLRAPSARTRSSSRSATRRACSSRSSAA